MYIQLANLKHHAKSAARKLSLRRNSIKPLKTDSEGRILYYWDHKNQCMRLFRDKAKLIIAFEWLRHMGHAVRLYIQHDLTLEEIRAIDNEQTIYYYDYEENRMIEHPSGKHQRNLNAYIAWIYKRVAREVLEIIGKRVELTNEHKVLSYELYKSVYRVEKYTSMGMVAQVMACVMHATAGAVKFDKDFEWNSEDHYISSHETHESDKKYCFHILHWWKIIESDVKYKFMDDENKTEDKCLGYAAKAFERISLQDIMDLKKDIGVDRIVADACEAAFRDIFMGRIDNLPSKRK